MTVIQYISQQFFTNTQIKLDLAYQRTDANCIHQKENSPKPINHRLTLKEELASYKHF